MCMPRPDNIPWLPLWKDENVITAKHFETQENYYEEMSKYTHQLMLKGNYGLFPYQNQPLQYNLKVTDTSVELETEKAVMGFSQDGTLFLIGPGQTTGVPLPTDSGVNNFLVSVRKCFAQRTPATFDQFEYCYPQYELDHIESDSDIAERCQRELVLGRMIRTSNGWQTDPDYLPPVVSILAHPQVFSLWKELFKLIYDNWCKACQTSWNSPMARVFLSDIISYQDPHKSLTEYLQCLINKMKLLAIECHCQQQKLSENLVVNTDFPNQATKNLSEISLSDIYPKAIQKQLEQRLAWQGTLAFNEAFRELLVFFRELKIDENRLYYGIPAAIWNRSHTEKDILDITTPVWKNLSIDKQISYSRAYQQAYAEKYGQTIEQEFQVAGIKIPMVFLPPIKYEFGTSPEELGISPERFLQEGWLKKEIVTISEPLWISKFLISQQQWVTVLRGTAGLTIWQEAMAKIQDSMQSDSTNQIPAKTNQNLAGFFGLTLPVCRITEGEVHEFCQLTHTQIMSEKVWEYACRALCTTRYPFGDDIQKLRQYAWYDLQETMLDPNASIIPNNQQGIHPSGQKLPNAFGIYDMLGNLWELTSTSDGSTIIRGGSWANPSYYCHPSYRLRIPQHRSNRVGFRVGMSVTAQPRRD